MSLASNIQYLGTVKTETWVYVAVFVLCLIGIICIAQKDTLTSKKTGTRIFGGICLGVVVLLLGYNVWRLSKEIVIDEKEISSIDEYNRQGGLIGEARRRSQNRVKPFFDFSS